MAELAGRSSLSPLSGLTRRAACALVAAAAAAPLGAFAPAFGARVARSGGTHSTLASALADAPAGERPYRILIGAGRWEEKLLIRRPNVELVGEEGAACILTSAAWAGEEKPGGGRWGTYGSATLTVEAPGFAARNLTIENGFDYLAHLRRGGEGGQAVALALGPGADRSRIERCFILGHQDTLYLRSGRVLVRGCLVAGGVDFIFGGAAAWIEGCEIRSRFRPGQKLQGYVAAPSTPRSQPFGLVFSRCRLTRDPGVPDSSVWLGRPWRAGGNVELLGQAAFLRCWMDSHIRPEGWTSMHFSGPGGYRMTLMPGDARLFEHGSSGPGAASAPGRRRLGAAAAERFTRDSVLGGWRPE
ncbi:MAG TPA: pectinesterase family protein [Allosphingosinicella sp.]